ncbi:dipeptidase [Planctomicrobium sp. SH668]|uniref:dipeptidase n=1 Tax=Planctomicrobium sp. SH668 TaxID=3448126 RepID=UPI003F5B4600
MADTMQVVEKYLHDHANQHVEDLKELLRIPSVSASSAHQEDLWKAAALIRDQLLACGCHAELVPTAGYPIVFGEWNKLPGATTVLVYGHYDVQPADPIDQWTTPPFEPMIRDGKIYARGATDDKGQMLTHVKSVAAWLNSVGELPVNVKFVIEGEEEVGSSNLDKFIEANQERCKCDVVVVSDSSQYAPGLPAITYGLRGIIACQVTLTGPRQDLHSGLFGGAVANPVNALARLLAKLQDDNGKILVPGFYDDVVALTPEERSAFAALPFDEAEFLQKVGSQSTFGEAGFTTLERRWARPTCDVNGIHGGYTGEGPKTIIPSKAMAKISFRLVANQDPEVVSAVVERYLTENCTPGLKLEFLKWHGCEAVLCDLNSPYVNSARNAIEKGFGNQPVMIREGGSIPVVATFKRLLGVDTLLLGWGQNTDNLHSPNEHFSLDAYRDGIRSSAWLWHELAQK